MVELSSFYIHVSTGTDYGREDYDAAAGRATGMLVNVLSSAEAVSALTGDAPRESCHSEIEVCIEEHELVVKAVVDVRAPEKVKCDKGKLTKMLKAQACASEWPKLKIAKRAVPLEANAA